MAVTYDEYGNPLDDAAHNDWFNQNAPPPAAAPPGDAWTVDHAKERIRAALAGKGSDAAVNSIADQEGGALWRYGPDQFDAVLASVLPRYTERVGDSMRPHAIEGPTTSIAQMQAQAPSGGGGEQFGAPQAMSPFTDKFSAPTADQARATPGFQFSFDNAMKAIERSGLAKGTAGTNQTWKALQEQATGLSDQNYGQTYDRAFNEYLTKANVWNTNEQNRFGSERANRGDSFGMFDSNRNFDLTKTNADRNYGLAANDQSFNQGRATTSDAWNRGMDIWSVGRTDRQDDFNNHQTYADYLAKYGLQPPP